MWKLGQDKVPSSSLTQKTTPSSRGGITISKEIQDVNQIWRIPREEKMSDTENTIVPALRICNRR